jgi:hypothetical protein
LPEKSQAGLGFASATRNLVLSAAPDSLIPARITRDFHPKTTFDERSSKNRRI